MNKTDFLEAVTPMFLKTGYHSLRMDDIAEELSMSKKTIYKIFPTKEKLVYAVNDYLFVYFKKMLDKYEPQSENVVELFYKVKTSVEEIADIEQQRRFIQQVAKYSPKVLKSTLDFSRNSIYRLAQITTEKAAQEGILLDVYDHETVNQIFATNYMSVKLFTEYESKEQFHKIEKEWFYMYLRGCFNEKGIKMLDDYVAKNPEVLH